MTPRQKQFSTEPTDDCYCQGDHPDWDYHHPDGCAKTAQASAMVTGQRGER